MRNLQEQVKKAFCYQKLFWPFTVWINCSSDLKNFANSRPSASNFKSFSRSLKPYQNTKGQTLGKMQNTQLNPFFPPMPSKQFEFYVHPFSRSSVIRLCTFSFHICFVKSMEETFFSWFLIWKYCQIGNTFLTWKTKTVWKKEQSKLNTI